MKYIVTVALLFLLSTSIPAAEFIPKKLSQMTDDLGVGTHTADTSDPHGTSMTQTNLTVGSLTVTNSLNLGTVTLSGYIKDNNGSATSTQLTSVQINSGTASLSAATIVGVSAPYIAQTNGTGSGNTLNNTKLSGNTAIGTTTAATDVVDIDLGSGNMLIQSNSSYPQIQEIRGGVAADGNLLATRIYQGKDSAGNSTNYAGIYAVSSNVTNGSETGAIDFYLSDAGSYALRGRWKGASLGIGTSTPANKLTVVGTIESTSGGVKYPDGNTQTEAVTQLVKGIAAGAGISIDQSTGTVTVTNVGSSTAGGWTDGTNTVYTTVAADQVIVGSTTAASNQILTVIGSQTTTDLNVKNAMSLAFTGTPTIDLAIGDNDTGLEQSSDNVIAIVAGGASTLVVDGSTNRVRIGTSTSNSTLQTGGTITASGFSGNGAGLTGVSVAFSAVTGSMSSSQMTANPAFVGTVTLPIIALPATTTVISGTSSNAILYNSISQSQSFVSGTKYVLHFNGGSGTTNFVDSSDFARTVVAVGSATHSPTQVKFGSTSCYLDGTGDSVTTTSSVTDFSPGSQTFYADIWAFYNGTKGSATATLFAKRSGAGSWANDGHEYMFSVDDDNKLSFIYNSSNNPVTLTGTNTLAFTAGWHHYKVVNASTGFFMYFDGVLAQSAAKITITATTGGTPKFVIGERNSDLYWNGYADEMNFVVGVNGETSNFTPPTGEYGAIYDKYTFSLIQPGTTTPSIKQEYGTASNTTVTYIQGDLIVDKPSRFSTVTAYCAEFSLGKPIIAQAYNLYPCDSEHKEIVETGSVTPQQEAFNTILNTGIYKFLWKTPALEKARPMITELTKIDYGRKDYKHEKELWEEVYKGNYITDNAGSKTVNIQKMNSDFEAYYLNKQYFDFDNMVAQEKNEFVYEKKKAIASGDPRNKSDNFGIVIDRECPDEYKLNDVPELSKMTQTALSALKEAAERIVKMEKEIKDLKAIVNP